MPTFAAAKEADGILRKSKTSETERLPNHFKISRTGHQMEVLVKNSTVITTSAKVFAC